MNKSKYSLGLYVHECSRMRYKAQFKGSQLLCTKTRQFFPIISVQQQLNEHCECLEADPRVIEERKKKLVHESLQCVVNSDAIVDLKEEKLTLLPCGYLYELSATNKNAEKAWDRLMMYLPYLPEDESYLFVL